MVAFTPGPAPTVAHNFVSGVSGIFTLTYAHREKREIQNKRELSPNPLTPLTGTTDREVQP